ncbi:ESX secretion-associated protein EspG [Amycolatopsis sp. H6(2020)]|nr:ESX secretion-associated protein EspG [Amycolatopsis sp. H6(2020)]
MAERFEFVLEVFEALVVGRATGGDVRRYPLRAGNLPSDPVRFVHVARQVYDSLEERRLSVSGELHPGVRTAFELLAAPRISVAVSGIDGLGADVAVLVVSDGAQALGITQAPDTDELLFSLFADEDLVEVVTGVLPPAPAASTGRHTVHRAAGREVSAMTAKRIADAEFDEEETDAFGMIEVKAVVRPGRRPPAPKSSDVAVLERVLAEPRLGGGHIAVSAQGRRGERLANEPLSWLDTADGRYLVHTRTGEAGELTAEYVPAGRADLARAIRDAIAAVY